MIKIGFGNKKWWQRVYIRYGTGVNNAAALKEETNKNLSGKKFENTDSGRKERGGPYRRKSFRGEKAVGLSSTCHQRRTSIALAKALQDR